VKQFWVDVRPFEKELVTVALESGADAVVVPEGCREKVQELGRIAVVAPDGDRKLGTDVIEFEIKSKADEVEAVKLARTAVLVLKASDWKIIPLENLIAQTGNLFMEVTSAREAETAAGILEKGVDGVLLATRDVNEIKKTSALLKGANEPIALTEITVTNVSPLAMGDRVCIDTCQNMKPGEGMLVGNSSAAMFLVHAETIENPYVAARPFRVNAGPVHLYLMTSGGRTLYLSELRAGMPLLVVRPDGTSYPTVAGRIKVEKRPLLLIEGEVGGRAVSVILQNAETIRLVRPGGEYVSVVKLAKGDTVLGFTESAGRHFGMKIEESIEEK